MFNSDSSKKYPLVPLAVADDQFFWIKKLSIFKIRK